MRLIPTDKSNRIILSTGKYGGLFRMEHYGSPMTEMGDSYQLLLITSNEEIKEGDFYLWKIGDKTGAYQYTEEICGDWKKSS